MHVMRLLLLLLSVNLVTSALAQTTATLRGPKEFDAPAVTQIGPLTPQDTLWRLAEQVRPDARVNMYQVMYALYLKNPNSFLDNNFNHLRTGAYLQVPTLREILRVDAVEAQRKSELDDQAWAEKIRIASQQKKEDLTAKQQDVAAARQEIKEEITRVESAQTEQLADIRDRLGASMANVESIVQENDKLKDQLGAVAEELTSVKQQLDKDSEIQKQLQQLLAQQAEMMAQQQEQIRKAQEGFNFAETWQKLANSPVGWAIAGLLPALVILFFIVSMIRRKGQKAAAVVTAATAMPAADPYYKSPLPPLDDSLDFDESSLTNLDDSLLNDRNAGIRLDEDDFNRPPARKAVAFGDDDLLDDSFDSPSTEPNKAGSAFDMDDLLDDPLDLAQPASKVEFDANNILSGDDLSALFSEADDEPFVAKTDFDNNNILSGNDLNALFDSLEDDEPPLPSSADNKPESHLVPDDVSHASSLALAAAEAAEMDELLEEIELDLPTDLPEVLVTDDNFDIDALVASTQASSKSAATPSADDDFDIDALLASTQASPAPSAAGDAHAADDVHAADDFDIDTLVAQNSASHQSTKAGLELGDAAELTALDGADESAFIAEEHSQFDSSELDAFAESLVDETIEDALDFSNLQQAEQLPIEDAPRLAAVDEFVESVVEDSADDFTDELDAILSEVAELKAQSSAKLSELQLPETAMELAAADFADAAISVEDVNHLLTDDDTEPLPAESPTAHLGDGPLTSVEADFHPDDIMLEDELPEYQPAEMTQSAPDLLPETAQEMPDLGMSDDNSVAKFEPPSSVERPSQILESYPELDFSEDIEMNFDDDELLDASVVDLDHFVDDAELPEINELESSDFDQLLQELAEVKLADDELLDAELTELPELAALQQQLSANDSLTASDLLQETEPPKSEVMELPDFVNIDKLLAATDDEQAHNDPSSRLDLDVGFDEFDDLISPDEVGDVDATDNGFGGKMDLVRAYIEIGDQDSANQLIKEIMAGDAPAHVKQEALSLKS